MKITDITALNVLVRRAEHGADADDMRHSGVYEVQTAIAQLRNKGYHIQPRLGRWFVDEEQVKKIALARKPRRKDG